MRTLLVSVPDQLYMVYEVRGRQAEDRGDLASVLGYASDLVQYWTRPRLRLGLDQYYTDLGLGYASASTSVILISASATPRPQSVLDIGHRLTQGRVPNN